MTLIFVNYIFLAVCMLSIAAQAQNEAVKRIYIAPDDHTDYMWTADEPTYRSAFIETLDYYIKQIELTKKDPAPYRAKWNCDGWLWLYEYEKNRSPQEFDRLMMQVKNGNISSPLNSLALCYGGQPAEAVIRGMEYPGLLERRYNIRFPIAISMENQTLPYGLSGLWAGSGVKWSWRGICGCASKIPDAKNREHEIYYYCAPDGSKVLMKWNSMINPDAPLKIPNQSMGGYAEARDPANAVAYITSNVEFMRRNPYSIVGIFGQGWDDLQTQSDLFPKAARELTNATRQIIVSNEEDFFRDIELKYGAVLPEERVTYGNEWDLYCASLAEVSARVKRAVEKLRGAEAMASICQINGMDISSPLAKERELANKALGLYWEHDWTADGPIRRDARAAWQKRLAGEIENYVDILHEKSRIALGGLIRTSGKANSYFVFNSLSFTRTTFADITYDGNADVNVIDLSTGKATAFQIIEHEGQKYLRILAADVPPLGYKVFQINHTGAAKLSKSVNAIANSDGTFTLENLAIRAVVTPTGAISSLRDLRRPDRELVKAINGRTLNDLGGIDGQIDVLNAGPVSVTLKASAAAPLHHTTYITLRTGAESLDIENIIEENFTDVRDWSFAFNLPAPDVHHEEVGAIIRARYISDGGQYADRNARTDWLTLNHFVDITSGGVGVTISNADCLFFKPGQSSVQKLDTKTAALYVLMGGQVDGVSLGIQKQDGDKRFLQRFSLRPHTVYDSGDSMRFALDHQNPLICGKVTGTATAQMNEKRYSLLSLSGANTFVWALKPAEDGPQFGIVVRLFNAGSSPENVALRFNSPITQARRVTHIETDLGEAPIAKSVLPLKMKTGQWQTFRVETQAHKKR